jgi:hypothetical protein
VFKERITSLEALVDTLNYYPIATFLLDIYARQQALHYIQGAHLEEDMMGNEFECLSDCSCDLRGTALDILAKSMKLSVVLKHNKTDSHKFARKSPLAEME